jgi:hypothetical protein
VAPQFVVAVQLRSELNLVFWLRTTANAGINVEFYIVEPDLRPLIAT